MRKIMMNENATIEIRTRFYRIRNFKKKITYLKKTRSLVGNFRSSLRHLSKTLHLKYFPSYRLSSRLVLYLIS